MAVKLTKSQKDEICEKYLSGNYTLASLGREYKTVYLNIRKILINRNIPLKSLKDAVKLSQFSLKRGKPKGTKDKNKRKPRTCQKRGTDHGNWKGGSKLATLIRNSKECRNWRKNVYEKDNYTCQNCGTRSCKNIQVTLNADHIIPFKQLLYMYNITDVKQVYGNHPIWDLDNGKTLCQKCHRKTPTYGGKTAYKDFSTCQKII